jgi:hypothetical protein
MNGINVAKANARIILNIRTICPREKTAFEVHQRVDSITIYQSLHSLCAFSFRFFPPLTSIAATEFDQYLD